MNKMDLIVQVADETDLPKVKAATLIDAVFSVISSALRNNEDVRLVGFGTFAISSRDAAVGHNPRTGETIHIAPARSVRFKPGKALRESMNPDFPIT